MATWSSAWKPTELQTHLNLVGTTSNRHVLLWDWSPSTSSLCRLDRIHIFSMTCPESSFHDAAPLLFSAVPRSVHSAGWVVLGFHSWILFHPGHWPLSFLLVHSFRLRDMRGPLQRTSFSLLSVLLIFLHTWLMCSLRLRHDSHLPVRS